MRAINECSLRFYRLFAELSASLVRMAATVHYDLQTAYQQPHRHYHTLQHITECLQLFDKVRHLAEQPLAVEFALWFHDAVYQPQHNDNEQQSAVWAVDVLQKGQVSEKTQQQVYDLIMATSHQQPPKTNDEKLIVDIDLAILAATPGRFAEYEQQIRSEYAWVSEDLYWKKRTEILTRLYNHKNIYHLPELKADLELAAQNNLSQILTTH